MRSVAIVGPGRMGQGVGLALAERGVRVILLGRTPKAVVPPLRLETGDWAAALRDAEVVLIAVPDDAVGEVAARLAGEGVIGGRHVVLHLSGLLDRRALAPLDASGAALGSMHPLQTVSDPLAAPGLFEGAWAGVEGDERAVAAAGELAGFLRMTPVPIPAGGKPLYHAGATVVANYAVALAALGESLARRAGVPEPEAARLYAPLLRGVAANLSRRPPAEALTGPIRRGDHRTVAAHLELLHGEERALYRALGRLTLALARAAGLDGERAAELERLLHEG